MQFSGNHTATTQVAHNSILIYVQIKVRYDESEKNWVLLETGSHAENGLTVRKPLKRGHDPLINAEVEELFLSNMLRTPNDVRNIMKQKYNKDKDILKLLPDLKSFQNKKQRLVSSKETVHGIRYLDDFKDWVEPRICTTREDYMTKG